MKFDRITISPDVMGGTPCIRGVRVPVATVVGRRAGTWRDERFRGSATTTRRNGYQPPTPD